MKKLIPLLLLGGFLAAVVIGCGPTPTTAPEKKGSTVDAKFSEYKDDKLTTKDPDKSFDVKGIKPMIDAKEGKWDDIKTGDKVTVTLDKDDKVTKVEKK